MTTRDDKDRELDALLKMLVVLQWVAGIAVLIVLGSYFSSFHDSWPTPHGRWGEFGDFVGGTLNPLISFSALIALIATFRIQVRELKLTKEELAKSSQALEKQNATLRQQNFEATFFRILELWNEAASRIAYRGEVGRDVFRVLSSHIVDDLRRAGTLGTYAGVYSQFGAMYSKDYAAALDPFFRTLGVLLELISEQAIENKNIYVRVIQAHLSPFERLVLFYFGLTFHGQTIKPYIERLSLFSDLPWSQEVSGEPLMHYEVGAFGAKRPQQPV